MNSSAQFPGSILPGPPSLFSQGRDFLVQALLANKLVPCGRVTSQVVSD